MRKVTKKMVKEVLKEAVDFLGIGLTETQFLLLLLNDEKLRKDWDEVGDVDTAFREELVQAITKDCKIESNEGHWPTGRTTKKNKIAFNKEFKEKAVKKGYILDEDFSLVY